MRPRSLVLAAALLSSASALACGVCVEDKMAAVYDHAVIGKALGQKHHVAFFHVDGSLVAGDATRLALERIAASSAGADPGGVRVSVESASLSIAFDPRRTTAAALQMDLERRLSSRKLSLMLLQVMDRPKEFSPSVASSMRKGK